MSSNTQLDVLAVFSHPDDAELTMAGTLIKLKSLGYRCGIADMTRGEMGTRGTPEIRANASQFYLADSKEPETRIAQKGFLRQIADRARYYGSLIGVDDGEPFYVREALNVDDPFALLTRPMNIYS